MISIWSNCMYIPAEELLASCEDLQNTDQKYPTPEDNLLSENTNRYFTVTNWWMTSRLLGISKVPLFVEDKSYSTSHQRKRKLPYPQNLSLLICLSLPEKANKVNSQIPGKKIRLYKYMLYFLICYNYKLTVLKYWHLMIVNDDPCTIMLKILSNIYSEYK